MDVRTAVTTALAAQVGRPVATCTDEQDLAALGLDSQGLMRVLLAVERSLGIAAVEPEDADLATVGTLIAGVCRLTGRS